MYLLLILLLLVVNFTLCFLTFHLSIVYRTISDASDEITAVPSLMTSASSTCLISGAKLKFQKKIGEGGGSIIFSMHCIILI